MNTITIQPLKGVDISMIKVGDLISFQKNSDETSEYHVKAFYKSTQVGVCVETTGLLLPGTVPISSIIKDLPDNFKGKISEFVNKITGRRQTFFSVTISESGYEDSDPIKEEKSYLFKIVGSTTANPAKSKVIAESDKTYVSFDLKGDKIITMFNGEQAGVVSNRAESGNASLEEREAFKQLIRDKDKSEIIDGLVISKTTSSFITKVFISEASFENAKTSVAKKEIGGIKEPLVKDGFDEKVLINIENYLLDNGFKVDDIKSIFNTYTRYPDKYKHLIPQYPNQLFNDNDKILVYDAYSAMIENCHILCSGEKGTGKNVFIETWAWILQRPLLEISINRETDKSDLTGSKTIEPVKITDEDGKESYISKIKFQKEVLLEAMEIGAIFNIDEINFADPGITGLLHSVGDGRKQLFVPGYGLVQSSDNFLMMATMNIGYQGTTELNEALADRFVDIVFKNNESIASILEDNCPDAQKSNIIACDKIYMAIIGTLKDADSSLDDSCVTVRGFIQALKMSKRIPLKRALIRGVADKIKDSEYRQNIIDLIETIVI